MLGVQTVADYRQSIREHLLASKKLLEKGGLSDDEAQALRKKIMGLSLLLNQKPKHPGK